MQQNPRKSKIKTFYIQIYMLFFNELMFLYLYLLPFLNSLDYLLVFISLLNNEKNKKCME